MNSTGNTNGVVERLILQSLMGIRVSDNPEEELLRLLLSDSDEDDGDSSSSPPSSSLARVESKLEKDIIRRIHSDPDSLRPNSGQAISVGEHQVCVSFQQEKPSDEYRVWEWHGHVMLLDDDAGYSPEYIYGNYFQRSTPNSTLNNNNNNNNNNGGLKDLIHNPNSNNSNNNAPPRVVHRNTNAANPR